MEAGPAARRFGGTVAETSRHLKGVAGLPWRMQIYCEHAGRTPRKIAVVLTDGAVITDHSVEVSLTPASSLVLAMCPACPPRLRVWMLDPVKMRARIACGGALDFVAVSEVGGRPAS